MIIEHVFFNPIGFKWKPWRFSDCNWQAAFGEYVIRLVKKIGVMVQEANSQAKIGKFFDSICFAVFGISTLWSISLIRVVIVLLLILGDGREPDGVFQCIGQSKICKLRSLGRVPCIGPIGYIKKLVSRVFHKRLSKYWLMDIWFSPYCRVALD